jgi:hypothetical protein
MSSSKILAALASAALLTATSSCEEAPSLSESPTKEQVVKYVEGKVGPGRKLLWYVPYKPEVQAHGSTAEPARGLLAYEESGFCFLYDIRHGEQYRHLIDCRTDPPKGTVRP